MLPFPRCASKRLLLVTQGERIPQSQIFPFHFYAEGLRRHYGAAVREVGLETVLGGGNIVPRGATAVAFQTPFDIPDADLGRLLDRLRHENPGARLACLDWFAPTDLRNAERMNLHVQVYVKKHVLRERIRYGMPTLGDTNLSDYYARRFGIAEQERCFAIPPGFLDKLVIGPSFATDRAILPSFLKPLELGQPRPIDLHARFAVKGTEWYQAMRGDAADALARVPDLTLAVGNNLPLHEFIAEMRCSKVCFSPFGYGEVCWRDYEAVMAGAVLLKPDMSHVETDPDIFRPWETYVPLEWDLSDFEDTLRHLVADAPMRAAIAQRAFDVVRDYIRSDTFVERMAPLFGEG